ncbi:MAG: response regulator transcription factor [Gammaproteobacteria bacterium]|nr:response regulator transcription factor [Gammaproteobacteria bacterium]
MQSVNKKIRILLVDDHAVVRAGYQMLLEQSDKLEIVAEASSGEQASKLFTDVDPDIVVMDLSLPGISGLEAIRRIIRKDPNAKVLVFTMHEDTVFVDQALRAGARGYLSKSSAPKTLIKAIEEIARGGVYIDDRLVQHLAFQKARDEIGPFSSLSTREFEIFCLLAEGLNTNEIAARLSIGYKTVANYSSQIKNKLQVNTTAELARLAIRHNILQA